MTDSEILKKAIEEAEKNSFKNPYFERNGWTIESGIDPNQGSKIITTIICGEGASFDSYEIIFSHDFAKAFWGGTYKYAIPLWQYHLQQMVLEPEPLKYLERFL